MLDQAQDVLKEIKSELYDRSSNPVFASFVISWVVINHDVVIALFSYLSFEQKTQYIDSYFSSMFGWKKPFWSELVTTALFMFVFPYLSASAYLVVFPLLSRKVGEIHEVEKSKNATLKKKAQGFNVLTFDQSEKLKADYNSQLLELETMESKAALNVGQVEQLSAEIEDLQLRLKEARSMSIGEVSVLSWFTPQRLQEMLKLYSPGKYKLSLLFQRDLSFKNSPHTAPYIMNHFRQLSDAGVFDSFKITGEAELYIYIFGSGFDRTELELLQAVSAASNRLPVDPPPEGVTFKRGVDKHTFYSEMQNRGFIQLGHILERGDIFGLTEKGELRLEEMERVIDLAP